MDGQVEYYDRFGEIYRQSILDCPEPELWTTDYDDKGRVYQEMKERLGIQQQLIFKYFNKEQPVFDIGCGFGRQAAWLGRNGFRVVGIDSSSVFIDLARKIFQKHGYAGEFLTGSLEEITQPQKFRQVLLLDVLEHFPPAKRMAYVDRICELIEKAGIIIVSLPRVKDRLSSRINNSIVRGIKSRLGYFLRKEEHPYPIPTRKQVEDLFSPAFERLEFFSSAPTDYYIFRKR